MSERFAAEEKQLCEQYAATARGPKRNGLFALWLLLRVAGDMGPPYPFTDRAHRRRSDALVMRLTSLTLPSPLRSPLREAARNLGDRSTSNVALILGGLAPLVRDTLGSQAAVAIDTAAGLAAKH